MNRNDSFSVRMGFEEPQAIQIDRLDKSTRLSLYDFVWLFFNNLWKDSCTVPDAHEAFATISHRFFELSSEDIFDRNMRTSALYLSSEAKHKFKSIFIDEDWKKIYDFIETFTYYLSCFIKYSRSLDVVKQMIAVLENFHHNINQILERENVGYRLITGKLVQITSQDELSEVQRAMETPYRAASQHIKKAVVLFADRQNPDYANTIKESISAIEAVVQELTGEQRATLGDGIKTLENKGISIHPAFKDALNKLYGFTSDTGGIRHANSNETVQPNQTTARFMLITSSAFVNYIIASTPQHKK